MRRATKSGMTEAGGMTVMEAGGMTMMES